MDDRERIMKGLKYCSEGCSENCPYKGILEEFRNLEERHAALLDICDALYAELRNRKENSNE